jgi:hypothetical protein
MLERPSSDFDAFVEDYTLKGRLKLDCSQEAAFEKTIRGRFSVSRMRVSGKLPLTQTFG